MADRYWVGGNANWDATAGTKWATTSGGVGGAAVPTAADDVYLDNGAGTGNVSVTSTAFCRSLNCTGYVGTLTQGTSINVGDATAGAGNIALKLAAGMTFIPAGNNLNFVSTSTTTQTITTAGKTVGNVFFNGAGGKWQLQDTFTTSASAQVNITTGEFYGNGQIINSGKFGITSSATTKVVDITNCALNLDGVNGGGWQVGDTATNLTLTATGSTITVSTGSNSMSFYDRRLAAQVYGDVVLNKTSGNSISLIATGGTKSCANLTITSASYANKVSQINIASGFVVTGTLTITGNSVTNRLLIASQNASGIATIGTPSTITAAVVSLSNVDFMDITAAGTASPFTGTSLGDCLGNTNITFDTPVTRYAVAAGNWSSTGMWSTSSGGSTGASVPLPQDTVILDASSGAGTYTADMPRMGKDITCTGFTRTLAMSSIANTIFGNLTLASGMTLTSNQALVWAGRSSHTITSASKTFGGSITINAFGGNYTLQDTFIAAGTVNHSYGGLISNNFDMTMLSYASAAPTTRTLNLGTSNINLTITAAANVFIQVPTGLTQLTSNCTINIVNASSNQRELVLNGCTMGVLNYTVAGSTGALYIRGTGGDSFSAINFSDASNARTLTFLAGITTTIRSAAGFNVNGTAGKLMTINTSAAGSAATISVASGVVYGDYLSIKDSTAAGGASFVARASTNVSGNTGWAFPVTAVAAGGNWSSTSTWDSGVVPTAATDVALIGTSGAVTVDISGVCRSFDCTGYTNTLTVNNGITWSIGDATAGAGNVAFKLSSGMTYTNVGSSQTVQFISTSATVQKIDFAGKTTNSVTFNPSSNGSWQYTGSHGMGQGVLTLAKGSLDINGQTCSWQTFAGNGASGTLSLGAASITLAGGANGTAWSTVGTITWAPNTAVITATATATAINLRGNCNGASFVHTGAGACTLSGTSGLGATVANYTRTGTATKTDSLIMSSLMGSLTVTGTYMVNGNSAVNRVLVCGSVIGSVFTVTAANVSCSNVDFRDITGAGAGSWNLAAITGLSGNCGGNSGITFTSPTTQTATGTASFSWSTHGWTSRVPLPQDTASIPNAFIAGRTVTLDMPRYGTIDFTGCTGSPAVTFSGAPGACEFYGHLKFASSMGAITVSLNTHTFIGVGQQNLTMNGNTWQAASTSAIAVSRDALQFQDAFVSSSGTQLRAQGVGYLDTNNQNITIASMAITTTTGTNLFGTSTLTLNQASGASPLDFSGTTAARVSAANATFNLTGISASARTVSLNAVSAGTLSYSVAGSTGALTITGGGTVGTLSFSDASNARTLNVTSGTTLTVTNLNINGTPGNLMTVQSVTASSPFTFSKASGVAYADYISLKDCTGSGGAGFVARASTNVSGNTGWAFPVTAVAAGGNWSSTSTWDSGVVPTAATDVAMISTSGQVTIDVNAVCRSIDCTGYTATLTQNSSTGLSIGTSTAGAGNVALKFVAGMTYTPLGAAGSAGFTFVSTSATVQTIDFAGKATSYVVINGVGSSYQCMGAWSHTAQNAFTHLTAGTLDLNGQTCTWGTVELKGTGTKVLSMGSSAISMTRSSAQAWWYSGSNLTVTANTAIITLTGIGAGIRADNTLDWNGLSVVMSNYGNSFTGNQTFADITKNGTATKLEYLTLAGDITCTGTFTVNGNSVTNRVLVKSSVVGTVRTITAATVSTSNSDWRDIAGAGAGSWNLAAITGLSGDCGGNSGITFTSPTTQTATGTSSFTWSTHGWTSRVPLPQDTASIPNAFTAGQTITMDMPRCGAVSFVGSTGNVAFSAAALIEIHGSLTLRASMGTFSASSLYFIGTSTHNLTSAGNTLVIGSYIQLWRSAVSLQDDLTNSLSGIYAPSGCIGNIVTNNFNITCTLVQLQTMTPTSPHQFGSSTVTLTLQTSTVVLGFVSAAAVSAASATFVVNGAPAARSILLNGASIGALTFTAGSSSLPITLTSASTIGTLTVGGGRTLSLPSGATTAVTNFITASNNNGYVYLAGGSGNYASTPDSAALSMTSDIDVRCKVALDSWASGAPQTLVAKFVFATPNASYWFGVDGTGHLQFSSSSDGTAGTVINSVSTVVTGLSAGTVKWVRGTFQPNDGAGHNVAKFYTSNDGSNWTQLGSTVTNNGAALIFDSTAPLEIGSDNFGTNVIATGKFYNAQVRNNILDNGTGIVFDANFAAKPVGSNTFTESSSNGATVTMNGSQAQVGDGRVGLNATTPGSAATLSKASGVVSCNYMSIQDSTATGGAQWYAGAASLNISNNTGWIFSTARDGSFLDFF